MKKVGEEVEETELKSRTKVLHDSEYFQAYSCVWIHWLMLSDSSRTKTYQNAINNASDFIKGKTVLDIGTGTGILSMFCAKAGAKKVYAVDASNFVHEAKMIIRENNLQDTITVVKGCLEDKKLPIPRKSADVIVSEWMGHFLICEAMIATVLIGRDRFLKPDGLLMPSSAVLFLAPITLADVFEKKVDYFDDLGGVNLSLLK
jgi:predicted RNA methylase